ncbi:MAG: RusA family crossover junction endodeoxyribonuclease [Bacteroidota bacterium]
MLPFECIVEGPPVSLQTKRRGRLQAWKQKIAHAARQVVAEGQPHSEQVIFRVTYYYDGASPDVDNIIKPIQDALVGIVYEDDDQVQETSARKRDLDGAYRIRGASPLVVQGFLNGVNFLHIKVDSYNPTPILD